MHKLISAYGMENVLSHMNDYLSDGSMYYVHNKKAFSKMAGSSYIMTASDYQALEKHFTEIVPQGDTDVMK